MDETHFTPPIGIATINRNFLLSNYGSLMQHYALRQVLKQLGYAPFRMDTTSRFTEERTRLYLRLKRRFCYLLHQIGIRPYTPEGARFVQSILFREKSFRRFYIDNIAPIIEKQAANCKKYLAGSDQIWTECDSDAFLTSIQKSDAQKIAYAVSADWQLCGDDPRWLSEAGAALSSFRHISLREKLGCEICKKLLPDMDITQTLDPVLLLTRDDYSMLVSELPVFRKKTLFCYLLNIQSTEALPVAQLAKLASKWDMQLRICGIQGAELFIPEKYQLLLSPEDFIKCFRDAVFVITNSFHGCLFALLFQCPFLCLKQEPRKIGNQNLRQQELLEWLNLEDRHISRDNLDGIIDMLRKNLDWQSINEKISMRRIQSFQWLTKSLGESS